MDNYSVLLHSTSPHTNRYSDTDSQDNSALERDIFNIILKYFLEFYPVSLPIPLGKISQQQ